MKQIRYIYKITNPSGKIYIGKTDDYNRRMNSYKSHWGHQSQTKLKNSILKYGWENHTSVVIWKGLSTDNQAYRLEKFFIKKYNSVDDGLNCLYGGNGAGSGENNPMYGRKHSDKSKELMSKAHKGKTLSESHKLKIKEANKDRVYPVGELSPNWGRKHSEETKKKISEAQLGEKNHNYGKTIPAEARKKISKSLSGVNHPFYGLRGVFAPNWGHKHSEQSKKKMSELQKGSNNSFYEKKHSKETILKYKEQRKGKKQTLVDKIKKSISHTKTQWSPFKYARIKKIDIKEVMDAYMSIDFNAMGVR